MLGKGNIRFRFSCCKFENFKHEEQDAQDENSCDSQLISLENSIADHSFPHPTGPEKRYEFPILLLDFILVKRFHTKGWASEIFISFLTNFQG